MKSTYRVFTLLLAFIMAFCTLAGCTQQQEQTSQTNPAETAEQSEPAIQDDSASAIGKVEYALPLFDEPYSVSVFWVQAGGGPGMDMIYRKDNEFWVAACEALNVNIDWHEPNQSVALEQYMIMTASQDMTDMVFHKDISNESLSVYPGGYDLAIEEEIYLPLNDLLAENAPNYWYYLNTMDGLMDALTTDNGNLYAVHMVYSDYQKMLEGPFIQTALYEGSGLEMPQTVEQWEDMFAYIKSQGIADPAFCAPTGAVAGTVFTSAFGTNLSSSYKVNNKTGELVYDATSDEYRQYIEWFITMYENGYVNADFISADAFDMRPTFAGERGVFTLQWAAATAIEKNFGLAATACPFPYLESSGSTQTKLVNYDNFCVYADISNAKEMAITTNCKEPEKALRLLDWFYSDEGAMRANYGWVEGESYEIVNGKISQLPIMLERDDRDLAYNTFLCVDEGPIFYILDRDWSIRPEADMNARSLWNDNIDIETIEYFNPGTIALSVEEGNSLGATESDIKTFVDTQRIVWMMGGEPLNDETWQAYIDNLSGMGLERMNQLYSQAYSRK